MIRIVWSVTGLLIATTAFAAEPVAIDSLDAERVIALARARAPQVRAAESHVLEARGRLSDARAFGRSNPTLEGVASRDDRFERRTQWELSVPIGLGPGWLARTGMARAELDRERHRLAEARRNAVGMALAAYYRVLHAGRIAELARERHRLATDLLRTAIERNRSGDIPRLDVLLAETETIRAQSALSAEERHHAQERIALAAALGLPSGERLSISGELADRALLSRTLAAPAPDRRPDLLAAEREVRAAGAARSLARTEWLPGVSFRLHYGHEGGDPLVSPGLAISVPLFQHGQASRAEAGARHARAVAELERTRNAAAAEVEGFTRAYVAATEAADSLTARGLPLVEESARMVQESYRAGKIDLPALLVVRRELLETRRDYLDHLLDVALAGIDLAVARGLFP